MTTLIQRLDPCAAWFRALARTRGAILWIFPVLLLGAYLGSLQPGSVLLGFKSRLSQRWENRPLLAEARRLNLDYEQVLAKPVAYVGKPVVWCVDTPAKDHSFVAGRPGWVVALTGRSEDYTTMAAASGGYCLNLLAVIDGFERGVVRLRPVERL